MRERVQTSVTVRAIVAVVALYALLLQPFIASATPRLTSAGQGILCLEHDTTQSDGGGSAGTHNHQCCTPASSHMLAPPAASVSAVVWAPELPSHLAWPVLALAPKTGPPTDFHAPRGPPAA